MIFNCDCGAQLLLHMQYCGGCGVQTVLVPTEHKVRPLHTGEERLLCANAKLTQCNWLVDTEGTLCMACAVTRKVPGGGYERSFTARRKFERAKQRLLFALLRLGIFPAYAQSGAWRLEINLLEDRRQNPNVAEDWVPTGYAAGVITINASEADRVLLEATRQEFGEKYRTLLGHLRHESGHYFWQLLVAENPEKLTAFRRLFGDERADYAESLRRYYALPAETLVESRDDYITPYAASHPHEDWAESWAHYLHMEDALATAGELRLVSFQQLKGDDFDRQLSRWMDIAHIANETNASLGLRPAYPFTPSGQAKEKMRFIGDTIRQAAGKVVR